MVIYGEVLFLENAITGAMLLWMTSHVCGLTMERNRWIMGSMLCGVFSFGLFLNNVGILWMVFIKLLFSLALMGICFHGKRLALTVLVFFVVSFLMGGITMGLAYTETFTWLHIMFGCSACTMVVWLMIQVMKDQWFRFQTRAAVTIVYQGKRIRGLGFVDTGNVLTEPFSGLPVCLVSRRLWNQLFLENQVQEKESLTLDYGTPDGRLGKLQLLRPDCMEIHWKHELCSYDVMIGRFLDEKSPDLWGGDCDVLIQGTLLEWSGLEGEKGEYFHDFNENQGNYVG